MAVLQSIRTFFRFLSAAFKTASAVEMHRAPDARDLQTLGIPASAFRAIHL